MGKKMSKHGKGHHPPEPPHVQVDVGGGSGATANRYAQTKTEQALVAKLSNPTTTEGSIATLLDRHFQEGGIADVRVGDGSQRTLLMLALQARHAEAARRLLDRGAALDARTAKGHTPLMILLSQVPPPNHDLVRIMLERQADVHATDHDGKTALMHAFSHPAGADMDSVRMLIERGASVNIRDRDGATPIMHASAGLFQLIKANKVDECLQTFAQRGANMNERDVSGDSVLVYWAYQAALRQKEPKRTLDSLFASGVRLDPSDIERLEYKKKRTPERQQGEPNEQYAKRQGIADSHNRDIDNVVGILREMLASGQYRLNTAGSVPHAPSHSPLPPSGSHRPSPFVPGAGVAESQRPGPGNMQRFNL